MTTILVGLVALLALNVLLIGWVIKHDPRRRS